MLSALQLLQIPGLPELIVLLLVLVLLAVPAVLVGGGVAVYFLFIRDDDGE